MQNTNASTDTHGQRDIIVCNNLEKHYSRGGETVRVLSRSTSHCNAELLWR
jgi:hypothetical protein